MRTHTHTESEIENPAGLSRHYEEKVKVYLKEKKRMKGVSILSIPLLHLLSPAHVWKIPCCHLLRRDDGSTNELSGGKKSLGEKRAKKGKSRQDAGGNARKGVEEKEREALKPVVIIVCEAV